MSLWLLDFNQCRIISTGQTGVEEAVDTFCVNDPYYPRPNMVEQLWNVYRDAYWSASTDLIAGTEHSFLPGLLIEGVKARLSDGAGGKRQDTA